MDQDYPRPRCREFLNSPLNSEALEQLCLRLQLHPDPENPPTKTHHLMIALFHFAKQRMLKQSPLDPLWGKLETKTSFISEALREKHPQQPTSTSTVLLEKAEETQREPSRYALPLMPPAEIDEAFRAAQSLFPPLIQYYAHEHTALAAQLAHARQSEAAAGEAMQAYFQKRFDCSGRKDAQEMQENYLDALAWEREAHGNTYDPFTHPSEFVPYLANETDLLEQLHAAARELESRLRTFLPKLGASGHSIA